MVLYHPNGRVVKQHEDYLEQEAAKNANDNARRYYDQINIAKKKSPNAHEEKNKRVHIVIDEQSYFELFCREDCLLIGEDLRGFNVKNEEKIPTEKGGLDRRTLMKCSSFANDYFTYEPDGKELHLPVTYPKVHSSGVYVSTTAWPDFLQNYGHRVSPDDITNRKTYHCQWDDQLSHVRGNEVTNFIVPWLKRMEVVVQDGGQDPPVMVARDKLPRIGIPASLLEKIHLYNVMLHLGIASYFQRPLIDALVLQMYQTDLRQCHLDTLEMTVGRFYARGVAVLDPVLSHFIGTYPLRSLTDRQNPKASDDDRLLDDKPPVNDKRTDETRYLPLGTARSWLGFSSAKPTERKIYPNDTVSVPPKLEVLGHSIRHWSGVRRNGSTAAAHTGYPLNVGRVLKYYRRRATSPIRTAVKNVDFADYATYRLKDNKHYQTHPPGGPPELPAPENEPENP